MVSDMHARKIMVSDIHACKIMVSDVHACMREVRVCASVFEGV